ncbi:cupredoxin domain-containing protein [Patescibacteria group bacterium]|nr:cupredoxin domain-containing protein [Patescibacteria group bacterium]
MNNKYISIVVLVLVIIGGWFLLSKGQKSASPMNGDKKMGMNMNMEAAPIPEGWNAPIPATSAKAKVDEFTVTGQNFSFSPSVMNVKKGDVVKITFVNSGGFHDFKIDEFKVATHQIKTGESETISFVADQTGSFQYYCSVGQHRANGMWGTLIVQ